MKKLDKLILSSFISPFLLAFSIIIFILLTVFLLSYLDEFIGKDLGFTVFSELIFYFSLNMMPVALPLAILLSSLITFGNLGEYYELTAIKSAGITLTRILWPVLILIVGLSIGSFYFNNIIVPKANLKAYSLLYDVRQKKPAVDFKEGTFYNGLPGYSIRVLKKDPDGKSLKGLTIYKHSNNNTELIVADSARVYTSNKFYLTLELYTGNHYREYSSDQELYSKDFVKNHFSHTKLIFNLSSLAHTPDSLFKGNNKMKDWKQLKEEAHAFRNIYYREEIQIRSNMETLSGFTFQKKVPVSGSQDSIILAQAVNSARLVSNKIDSAMKHLESIRQDAISCEIEMHRKYTQSIACLILFLIGAPLGAIIRKGGFGIPVLISIIFFILLYVLSIIGEKLAKENVIPVWLGMWAANMILMPIGLFFMRQARNDSRIFETDFYRVLGDKISRLFKRKMQKT